MPINLFIILFAVNSVKGSHFSQSSCRQEQYICRYCSIIAFAISVQPSISGWNAVESYIYIFNYLYRAYQKSKINQLPQLNIIKLGSLYSLKTYLTKHLATEIILIKSIGIICRIFIKQSITTIIFINPLLLGKSTIKLIKILRHFYIRIGNS